MGFRPIDQIDRNVLMRHPGGELYEVIGFITEPAVILRRVKDGRQTWVIPTSLNAQEWQEVEPAEAQAELLDRIRNLRDRHSFEED